MLGVLAVVIVLCTAVIGVQHSRYQRDTRAQMHTLAAELRGEMAAYHEMVAYVRDVERRLAALEARTG